MRRCAAALTATLALTLFVLADGPGRSDAQFMPGIGQRPITFKPIDTSKVIGGVDPSKYFHTPRTAQTPPNLANFFRKPTQPNFPPKFALTPVLTPGQNPFQPKQPQGKFLINPTPPKAGGKTIFNSPYNPAAKKK
jgi:hypothetical protein